ncbi:hypothetical protein WMY93_029713 [Mugilogobius chulae]|uniref:Uncharacterized protein n=1 Tax=Mugilogobius chulae TaxID=88201 RepID=A0AAW0MPT1_9GOBI
MFAACNCISRATAQRFPSALSRAYLHNKLPKRDGRGGRGEELGLRREEASGQSNTRRGSHKHRHVVQKQVQAEQHESCSPGSTCRGHLSKQRRPHEAVGPATTAPRPYAHELHAKSRIKQLEKELQQTAALPKKTEELEKQQENHSEETLPGQEDPPGREDPPDKELNRQLQEQLAINLKQKRRVKELQEAVQEKEALEMTVEKLQQELDTRDRVNLQEQETNEKLLHINKVLMWRVKNLENG